MGQQLIILSALLFAAPLAAQDYNAWVIQEIQRMPRAGDYGTTPPAFDGLRAAVALGGRTLRLNPRRAAPSFCSSATYLVLLGVLNRAAAAGRVDLSSPVQKALLVGDPQPDGHGFWGCWNANGPGAARLFHLTGMGVSFTDPGRARPGDFLKIFWTEAVGRDERGHLVVFLGMTRDRSGAPAVRFWSSNQPNGYGEKRVPMEEIARLLFTRLTRPERVSQVLELPDSDPYLARLLRKPSSFEEACLLSGVTP